MWHGKAAEFSWNIFSIKLDMFLSGMAKSRVQQRVVPLVFIKGRLSNLLQFLTFSMSVGLQLSLQRLSTY